MVVAAIEIKAAVIVPAVITEVVKVIQSLSCVWLFVTPLTGAHQTPLSSIISQSLLKLVSIDSVMLSNHLILRRPLLLLPSIFSRNKFFSNDSAPRIRWLKFGASASASALPRSIQDWFPLGLTALISLQSKGLSRTFSSTTVQKHKFFRAQPSLVAVVAIMVVAGLIVGAVGFRQQGLGWNVSLLW